MWKNTPEMWHSRTSSLDINTITRHFRNAAEAPSEATELFVGGYTVAVMIAGEYVFVLEKGTEYEFGTWPHDVEVEFWAQDDMAEYAPLLMSWRGYWDSYGSWTSDGGWSWLYNPDKYPPTTMQTNIIQRLLMFGYRNSDKADLSFGDIFGLYYTSERNVSTGHFTNIWHLGNAPVGFDRHGNCHPVSQ